MGITRKSKRRTVSHADTSLISAEDSSSIRHRFFRARPRAKLPRTSFCLRPPVQKCMIAAAIASNGTRFLSAREKNYFAPRSIAASIFIVIVVVPGFVTPARFPIDFFLPFVCVQYKQRSPFVFLTQTCKSIAVLYIESIEKIDLIFQLNLTWSHSMVTKY